MGASGDRSQHIEERLMKAAASTRSDVPSSSSALLFGRSTIPLFSMLRNTILRPALQI